MPKPSELLVRELAGLGIDFLDELIEAGSERWRQVFIDRDIPATIVDRFFESLVVDRAFLISGARLQAHRVTVDTGVSKETAVQPDAHRYGDSRYASRYSKQEIWDRSG